jgi:hypothetical protein
MNEQIRPASFGKSLETAIRENPLPAALIGMGLVWLVTGNRRVASAASVVRDAGGRMSDVATTGFAQGREALQTGLDTFGQGVGDLALKTTDTAQKTGVAMSGVVNSLRDTVGSASSRSVTSLSASAAAAADAVREIPTRGTNLLAEAQSTLKSVFERQPLMLGAVGIAVGAAIASSFASTELENSFAGSKSDDMKKAATEFVSAQADRATELASAVKDTVLQEASVQGLSLEGAKTAAQATTVKLHKIGDAAADSVKQRI